MDEETLLAETDLDPKIVNALATATPPIATLQGALTASDEELQAIKGVGPAAIEKIRAAKQLTDGNDDGEGLEEGAKIAEYERLIASGAGEEEARAEVWPEDAPTSDPAAEPTNADDGDQGAEKAADSVPTPSPSPRPRPTTDAASPPPVGCQWVRLRGKVRKIVTEAIINRTGQIEMICLFPGMRYAMPKDVHIGAIGRWHPMVVREEEQADYPALDIADIAYSRWTIGRKDVAHFLAAASSVIEKHQGAEVAKLMVEEGPQAVLARYQWLHKANPDEVPAISYQIMDPDMPVHELPNGESVPLVVEINEEERANLLSDDELCDPESGKSFASKDDLLRYQAQQARRQQIPEWLKKELDDRLASAVLRAPARDAL